MLAAVALAVACVALAGCTGGRAAQPAAAQESTGSVRGLLTDVQPASIVMLREVELRSDDGRTLRFTIEGDTGITPGHARDHMVTAEPVTITYRSTPSGLVALRIADG